MLHHNLSPALSLFNLDSALRPHHPFTVLQMYVPHRWLDFLLFTRYYRHGVRIICTPDSGDG